MTIEFDFRPGYGLWNARGYDECDSWNCTYDESASVINSFYDWSVNAMVSYKF